MQLRTAANLATALLLGAAPGTLHAATLIGSVTTYRDWSDESNVDLTATGTVDWAVWGEGDSTSMSPTNSKAGAAVISDLTDINPNGIALRGLGQFGEFGQTSFQWSDGSPTVAASWVNGTIQHNSTWGDNPVGSGFGVTVIGSTEGTRTVDVWFGTHRGTTEITATLPGADPVSFIVTANEYDDGNYNTFAHATFTFQTGSPADSLYITTLMKAFTPDSDFSNAYLSAVAVSGQAIPEASTALLGCLAAGALFRRRRA